MHTVRKTLVDGDTAVSLILKTLFFIEALQATIVLMVGFNQPLLDMHGFRQTQTALCVYWLMHGGGIMPYELPVLGFPWAVPFEFPVYQLLVAAISEAGVPLDAAGRLVSFGFFLGVLWPLRSLYRSLQFGSVTYLTTAILYIGSPIYLFWSRTFLIESCALFFGMAWLACLARYSLVPSRKILAAAIVTGSLALLAKATTFPPFFALGMALIGIKACKSYVMEDRDARKLGLALFAGAMMALIPLCVGTAWVYYADIVKNMNAMGVFLTSDALKNWNFGTWAQRTSGQLWISTIVQRVAPDTLGRFVLLSTVVAGTALASRRYAFPALCAAFAFVLPFLLFTNLHLVHNYYQYANAIFLLAAVGFGLSAIYESGSRRLMMIVLLVCMSIGEAKYFYDNFFGAVVMDQRSNRILQIAALARAETKPSESLIIVGDDWSPEIPYYAQRKSLALPYWAPAKFMAELVVSPSRFLGDSPLGGIIECGADLSLYTSRRPVIARLLSNRRVLGQAGGCRMLSGAVYAGPPDRRRHKPKRTDSG